MKNLNKDQADQLHTLLSKEKYDLNEAIAIVELYILCRKGVSIKINLEKGTDHYAPIMRRFALEGQLNQLITAQTVALQWFGLNYRQDD